MTRYALYALKCGLLNTRFSLIKKKNCHFLFCKYNYTRQFPKRRRFVHLCFSQNNTAFNIIFVSFLILKATKEIFFFTYLNRPTYIFTILKYFIKIVAFEYIDFHFFYKRLILERIYSKWTTFKPIIKYINTQFPLIIKCHVLNINRLLIIHLFDPLCTLCP